MDVDTCSLLDFTVLEPVAGDATFSITIWLIFQLLLQETPRIIGIGKEPNRHAASQKWLAHLVSQFRGDVGIRLPRFHPRLLCDEFSNLADQLIA